MKGWGVFQGENICPSKCKALGSIIGTAKNQVNKGVLKSKNTFHFPDPIPFIQPLSYIHILKLHQLYLTLHDFSLIGLTHSPLAVIQRPLPSQASANPCPKIMTITGHTFFHTGAALGAQVSFLEDYRNTLTEVNLENSKFGCMGIVTVDDSFNYPRGSGSVI